MSDLSGFDGFSTCFLCGLLESTVEVPVIGKEADEHGGEILFNPLFFFRGEKRKKWTDGVESAAAKISLVPTED